MSRAHRAGWLVAGLLAGSATAVAAQMSAGVVVGSVRATDHGPVSQATIVVLNERLTPVRAVSDDSGAFRLANVSAGTTRLTATRIGFWPETLTVVVRGGETVRAEFRLRPQVVRLDAKVVEADPLAGKMGPFNRRRRRGVGAFITRPDIEKRHAATLSELLRYLPGVGVEQRMAGEPQPVRMQRSVNSTMQSSCTVQLYVDGHPYPNGNIDDFTPIAVEGVEVYRSASEIPADFRSRDATCGVIAIWTRDPQQATRAP